MLLLVMFSKDSMKSICVCVCVQSQEQKPPSKVVVLLYPSLETGMQNRGENPQLTTLSIFNHPNL